MKPRTIVCLTLVLHVLGIGFYYSPISLTGWWSDVIFMYVTILFVVLVYKKIKFRPIKALVLVSCVINGLFVPVWLVIIGAKYIPKGKFDDPEKYAYYTDRGNTGLTSGCYGQVHIYHQISWLPFLEMQTDFIPCDDLGYECWLEDC